MPPASPVPGCSSGEVCTDSIATRRGAGVRCCAPHPATLTHARRAGSGVVRAVGGGRAGEDRAVTPTQRPVGTVTRGTTNPNRLRRIDRWLAGPARRRCGRPRPAGRRPRLRRLPGHHARARRPARAASGADVEVLGLEIDPARVRAAQPLGAAARPLRPRRVRARRLELGRQARPCWCGRPTCCGSTTSTRWPPPGARSCARLAPGRRAGRRDLRRARTAGRLGRCRPGGPLSLTLSLRLRGLERPSDVAERLPKVLIHRNVPGEPVHAWLHALDDAWDASAPWRPSVCGNGFWRRATRSGTAGWPVLGGPRGGGSARSASPGTRSPRAEARRYQPPGEGPFPVIDRIAGRTRVR